MAIQVKICGLTTREAVEAAVTFGADYLGFIFYPGSPRYLTFEKAASLCEGIPPHVKRVSVFVDTPLQDILRSLDTFPPHIIQLHGKEEKKDIQALKKAVPHIPVMKAIAVQSRQDINRAHTYEPEVDMLLFDAKAPASSTLPGGNGIAFDWSLLAAQSFQLPWLLSGGLHMDNVAEAIHITGAKGIDVSSSLEEVRGIKDPLRIKTFLETVKALPIRPQERRFVSPPKPLA